MSVCVVGAINLDWVARAAELPRPGETVLASDLSRYAGGKGLNQAVAAVRAGAEVAMVGLVGADDAGDWLLNVMLQAGVGTAHVSRHDTAPTGQAFITVSEAGENTIVVAQGANAALSPVSVSEVYGARVLLAQLETALAPVASLFEAELPGCLKVLNAAPALSAGARMFASCDVLVLNETELAAYAGQPASLQGADAAVQAARRLLARPHQRLVVTLGAAGVPYRGRRLGRALSPVVPQRWWTQSAQATASAVCWRPVWTKVAASPTPPLAPTPPPPWPWGRRGAASAMPTRAEIEAALSRG